MVRDVAELWNTCLMTKGLASVTTRTSTHVLKCLENLIYSKNWTSNGIPQWTLSPGALKV